MESKPLDSLFEVTPKFLGELEFWLQARQKGSLKGEGGAGGGGSTLLDTVILSGRYKCPDPPLVVPPGDALGGTWPNSIFGAWEYVSGDSTLLDLTDPLHPEATANGLYLIHVNMIEKPSE